MTNPTNQVTERGRLPTFLILGVAKAGTSSLYAYLGQHPQVYTSPLRAPNFFGLSEQPALCFGGPVKHKDSVPTLARYCALFAGAQNEIALGEGSSFFNFTPRAAARIHHYIPDAKLILILRQPAELAYSQYLYARRVGWEPASTFKAALDAEPARCAEGWFPFLCYRESSRYAAKLHAFDRLFPKAQLHISLFDDFRRNTAAIVRAIYRFIGVDPDFTPDVSINHNPARLRPFAWQCSPFNARTAPVWKRIPTPWRRRLLHGLDRFATKPPPLNPALHAALTSDAQQDILETQQLIGKDLSHWLVRQG